MRATPAGMPAVRPSRPETTISKSAATFLSLTTSAKDQIAVARSFVAPLGDKPASPTPVQLEFSLADAHEASGKLLRASATLGKDIPATWTRRAAQSINEGIAELTRWQGGKPADAAAIVASFDQAIYNIETGRRMLISPPSTQVFDGS